MNHEELSDIAVEALSQVEGVMKIVTYGSVERKDYRSDSDVDIAVVIDDTFRSFPLAMDGSCVFVMDRIRQIETSLPTQDIRMHVVMYWESDYEKGIELVGNKYPGIDLLHEVGSVKYSLDLF